MKYNRFVVCVAMAALLVTGCRKESYDLVNPNESNYYYLPDVYGPTTFALQFEALWQGINSSYVFWRVDTVNWDARYDLAKPLFEAMDKQDTVTDGEIFHALDVLCHGLIDHHMAVRIRNTKPGVAQKQYITYKPSTAEVESRTHCHPRYMPADHLETLLRMEQVGRITNLDYTVNENGFEVLTCIIDGKYAYLNMNNYRLLSVKTQSDEASVHQWRQYQDWLGFCQSPECKGVILDNRGNYGGYVADLTFVVGPFLANDVVLGYTYTKQGLGRLDYGAPIPFTVHAQNPHLSQVPYVVLCDVRSISMGEITTFALKNCRKAHVVGERTYGATGPLNGCYDTEYDGTFGTSDGNYYVYTSSHMVDFVGDGVLEGKGVTPNQEVYLPDDYATTHNDTQLDAAISYLMRR